MDGLERGLKPDRGRLASGEQVALHPGVDGHAREAGEPRGDLDFSRREALLEWRFDRESFADRGYDRFARNRHRISAALGLDSCPAPRDPPAST